MNSLAARFRLILEVLEKHDTVENKIAAVLLQTIWNDLAINYGDGCEVTIHDFVYAEIPKS
jgi:hypothetical protein